MDCDRGLPPRGRAAGHGRRRRAGRPVDHAAPRRRRLRPARAPPALSGPPCPRLLARTCQRNDRGRDCTVRVHAGRRVRLHRLGRGHSADCPGASRRARAAPAPRLRRAPCEAVLTRGRTCHSHPQPPPGTPGGRARGARGGPGGRRVAASGLPRHLRLPPRRVRLAGARPGAPVLARARLLGKRAVGRCPGACTRGGAAARGRAPPRGHGVGGQAAVAQRAAPAAPGRAPGARRRVRARRRARAWCRPAVWVRDIFKAHGLGGLAAAPRAPPARARGTGNQRARRLARS
mmetsp:Transcript_7991/g.23495  ORF Transcript_7991/g.23495 Transcript_7991/m.23495 type:complete len:290 (+) Transcript_7991:224-1093(+)